MTPKYIFVAENCICHIYVYIPFPWGIHIGFLSFEETSIRNLV